MKNSFRILFAVAVAALLVAAIGIGSTMAKQIDVSTLGESDPSMAPMAVMTVADGTVEWTDSTGADVTHVKQDVTAVFYITDDALETTKTGVATFTGHATASQFFDIPNASAGAASSSATTTGVTMSLVSTDYSTSVATSTPWTGAPSVAATTTGSMMVSSYSATAGTVALLTATGTGTTTVSFTHDIVDSYSGSASASRRAKVSSTSDSQGEYVTITEVASVGSTNDSATSQVFLGSISLSSEAATQGTNSDGVWVVDGDTLTVTYMDEDGVTLDSDAITVDATKPSVSNVTPADDTFTGTKNPSITFDVTDAGSGISSTPSGAISIQIQGDLTGATTTVTSSTPSYQPISDGYRVIFTQQESWLSATTASPAGFGVTDGSAFAWGITVADTAGNSITVNNDLTIDLTKPTVSSAVTGTAYDTVDEEEDTGETDSVKVAFSEDLDATSVDAADFTVGGVAPTAATVGTKSPDKDSVYLTVAAQAADSKPEVKVVGTINDAAGNSLDTSSSVTTNTTTASDGLKPTLTSTVDTALAIKDDEVKVTVTSDEKLGTSGLVVSIQGPSGSAANTANLTTKSPSSPLAREGELTIPSGATGNYGVSIQGTDIAGNAANNLTKVTSEAVSSSNVATGTTAGTTIITVAKGPIGDNNFDGSINATDITSVLIGTTAVTVSAVDAGARTITVSNQHTSGDTATVTYHYPATESFEIDNSAPTITDTLLFDPSDGASTTNKKPFISVKWDEDEYAGDSYTTVTLTKASLEDPDGTATDILSLMSTTDDITFFYRPTEDMAVGEYTLTVSAKDTAGNEKKDQAAKITIKAKTKTKIALLPGWNLVSIPGTPADSAINTVVTPTEIDTVLTYDPSVPGFWLSAERIDGTGDLVGTLTDITATQAYWVHTTSDSPIEVDIVGVEAGAQQVPPALMLNAGWNLVPAVSLDPDFASVDADTYLSGLKWSKGYGFDRILGQFRSFIPQATTATDVCNTEGTAGAGTSDCIESGKGYWVYLTESGTLIP